MPTATQCSPLYTEQWGLHGPVCYAAAVVGGLGCSGWQAGA
jgi:hypothetical protein